MTQLSDYQHKYKNIRFERDDGILQITVHTNGGPMLWGACVGSAHTQLGDAFYEVGRDPENRVVILTGSGEVFCTDFNYEELPASGDMSHDEWYVIMREGRDLLMNLLDIDVPVISAINGPAHIHAEIPLLSDIIIAADHTTFADTAHTPTGTVPGDGVHVIWPMLLGPNRGRYFLMMAEKITAAEAKTLGLVGEVLPADQVLPRAWEIARSLLSKRQRMLRASRMALTQRLKLQLMEELTHGLLLEGHGI